MTLTQHARIRVHPDALPHSEEVILVDSADTPIGTMEKLQAHQEGRLHRAFSIFLFHPDGRMLLQKRASSKYYSGELWSNACCSHPRPGEATDVAATRRLFEEVGLSCDLREIHTFIYRTEFPNGLTEYEYDHVLVGITDTQPVLNPEEAEDWGWVDIATLRTDLKEYPERYTYWLRESFEDVVRML